MTTDNPLASAALELIVKDYRAKEPASADAIMILATQYMTEYGIHDLKTTQHFARALRAYRSWANLD